MEKGKRWSVTYTKHLKQKRKVYQDGFLQLDSSGHKVMLFDDCEKLLDSRFVKLDDIVKAGETITFGSYLVDIGDPDGDSKSAPTNFQEKDKILNRGDLLRANKLKFNSTSSGNTKNNSGMHKTVRNNLSPSQNIIREFKKIEVKKYEISATSPNTVKENITEWEVLYTTQITKKAKTFHDGNLRLVVRGSQGRQAMLYDATGRLLDNKFLKKEEIVTSGQSLTFDGHLVDIGECVGGEHKTPTEVNVQGRKCDDFKKAGEVYKEQSQPCDKVPLEWDAMYTTQTTARAKKYHDGVIKLSSCGSSRMQATLLTEDGTILGRRFLNLSEGISSGSMFQLPNYLVQIGEPHGHREGKQNEASVSKFKDVKLGCLAMDNNKLSTGVPARRPLRKPQDSASPLQDTKSKIRSTDTNKIISSGEVLDNKPLRNANAILSILKRPNTWEGNSNVNEEPLNQRLALQSTGFVQFDIQNHVKGQSVQGFCKSIIKIEDCKEETFATHNSNGDASEKVVHSDHSVETNVSEKINIGDHDVDPPVLVSFSLDSESPTSLEQCDASKGNEKAGDLTEVLSSKATSNLKVNGPSEEVKHGVPQQEPCGDNMDANSTLCAEASVCKTISSNCISPNHVDIGRQASLQQKPKTIIDEFPSFDLGF